MEENAPASAPDRRLDPSMEAGYEEKLLFSLDTTNERLRSYGAKNMGLDYILSTFKGLLAERGVSEDVLCKIMTVNPSIAISMEK